MKKVIAILVLGLLWCGTVISGTPHLIVHGVDENNLLVMVDPSAKSTFAEIKSVADAKCKSLDRGNAVNISASNYLVSFRTKKASHAYPFNCAYTKGEKKKVELASMINDAKNTCKELGFEEGTEKFSDCSLKLYSQSVELAAKQNQTVVMQPQSSGSNSITIYDPVRDSNALIRQGQRMLSGACTLGINC